MAVDLVRASFTEEATWSRSLSCRPDSGASPFDILSTRTEGMEY